jgi:hypothetical protein
METVAVRDDRELLGILAELPLPKQQPNLLLTDHAELCA